MIAALIPMPAPEALECHVRTRGRARELTHSPTTLTTNHDCEATSSLRTWDINHEGVIWPFDLRLDAYTSLASRNRLFRSKMESSIQSNSRQVNDEAV